MAEAILRRRLDERGVAGQVSSAGFLAPDYPAMDEAIAAMAADGFDLSGHRSRSVTREALMAADLVIGMTRQHLLELVLETPDNWSHLYQLRELVQRAEAVGRRPAEQPFDVWLDAVGDGRSRAGFLTSPIEDDIADPVGEPPAVYQQTRRTLDDLLTRLAAILG
jgi:protein-tyrosine phosphatase